MISIILFDGGDLSAGMSMGEVVSEQMKKYFNPLINDIDRMEKPVVMAVNGVVAGGGVGFALSGDIVIAARSASFRLVFGPRPGYYTGHGHDLVPPPAYREISCHGPYVFRRKGVGHESRGMGIGL